MENKYKREKKESKPVVAICYDFDKTLTPTDMQAQGFIQDVDYNVDQFWKKSNGLAETNDMDQNLAYMYTMKDESSSVMAFTKSKLIEYGKKVQLFKGVDTWFKRIRDYGEKKGVIVEHYIISSGLKEIIEGTSVAKEFKKIYASSFYYNDRGVAIWPAQVINYTNKTQFLFRIKKGTLDINDSGVNDFFEEGMERIPFENMIYIGDSDTDIPCMKLIDSSGGYSIGVYNGQSQDKQKVYRMMNDKRIKYFTEADYSENKELEKLVKKIIDKTVVNQELKEYYLKCKKESDSHFEETSNEKQKYINALESSQTFKDTHTNISLLNKFNNWDNDEIEKLCNIALKNSQVRSIIMDDDLIEFYKKLISSYSGQNRDVSKVKSLIKE